jgi:hypothetical protein
MSEYEIQKAIDNYIAMEEDAKIMELIRKGVITGIEMWDDARWRVFTKSGFAVGDSPQLAVREMLKHVSHAG